MPGYLLVDDEELKWLKDHLDDNTPTSFREKLEALAAGPSAREQAYLNAALKEAREGF